MYLITSSRVRNMSTWQVLTFNISECADRELLPVFHEVSVYPKKELPFFILFTAGLCSFTALLALLTHQYPESMGVSRHKYSRILGFLVSLAANCLERDQWEIYLTAKNNLY